MKVDEIFKIYQENGNQELIKYIQDIVDSHNGQWDKGIKSQSDNLTVMLLYEYATSIEKLTGSNRYQSKRCYR